MVICNVRVAPHLRYWLVELFVWHVLSNSMTSKEWFHVGALSSIVGELSCIDYCRSCDRRCPEGASRHNQSRSRFIPNHLDKTVWVSSRAITTCAVLRCVVACVPLVLLEGACPASGALLSKCDPGNHHGRDITGQRRICLVTGLTNSTRCYSLMLANYKCLQIILMRLRNIDVVCKTRYGLEHLVSDFMILQGMCCTSK